MINQLLKGGVIAALFLFATSVRAYHLELEAQPAAVFPLFAKFGTIDIHVYDGGVRADTMWLDAFSRNGSDSITVMNPIVRLYGDMPIASIDGIIDRLGSIGETERSAVATLASRSEGKVGPLKATRHRLVYGEAYIDYWTTMQIPENPQLRRIVNELIAVVSPGTAATAKNIKGTPVYVELNFRRFKKVALVKLKRLTPGRADEAEGLSVGSYYLKAPMVDALWK